MDDKQINDGQMTMNKEKSTTKEGGFTLVEVLIYSALLAFVVGAAMLTVNNILSINENLLVRNELAANMEFIEKKMDWAHSEASSTQVSNGGAVLEIVTHSTTTDPINFTYASTTSDLFVSVAENPSSTLNNSHVDVLDFTVEEISNTQTSSSVDIFLELQSVGAHTVSTSMDLYYTIE